MNESEHQRHVFDSVTNRNLRGYASAAGAVALVGAAVVGFFLGLRSSPEPFAFHSMTTLPMIMAVGLFTSAYATLRSPTRVIVGDDHLIVLRGQAEVGRWRWDEIALAPASRIAVTGKRGLKLYGAAGNVLVTLTDDLGDFDAMSAEIKRRMADHPSAHCGTVARGKHRRTGALLMVGGILFFALAVANAWMALTGLRSAELLRTRGQPAEAVIVRKFTAPDGRTRRIEYKVNAPDAPTENVEVTPIVWAVVRPNQRIAVIAVPGRPDVSHLAAGQVDDNMNGDPRTMLALSALVAGMSVVFFVGGLLNRRGLQLKWDRERQRPRLAPIEET